MAETLLFGLAEQIRVAAHDAVTATVNGAPKRSGVVHGTSVVYDECCAGLLWVRWTTLFVTSSFPNADGEGSPYQPCNAKTLAAVYEVGVLRCVPALEASGRTPKVPAAAELAASADQLGADASALVRGLRTLIASWGRNRRAVLGTLEPAETGGRCGGSVIELTVELC